MTTNFKLERFNLSSNVKDYYNIKYEGKGGKYYTLGCSALDKQDLESLMYTLSKELSDDVDNEKGHHYVVLKSSNIRFKSGLELNQQQQQQQYNDPLNTNEYKVVSVQGQPATKAPEL